MKTITKLITLVGIFVLAITWVQWFFRFPDPSQLFLGTIGAVAILGGAYVNERLVFLTLKQENLEKRLDSLIHPEK